MKTHIIRNVSILVCIGFAAAPSVTTAAIIADDFFAYTAGTALTTGGAGNGGTGFSAAWSGATTNNRSYTGATGTFSTPTNYSVGVDATYAALTAGTSSLSFSRTLSSSINFNSTGTYYFSALVSMLNNGTSSGDVFFPRFLDASSTNVVSFGMNSSNAIKITTGSSTTSSTTLSEGASFDTATQYLIIGKMVLSDTGNDQFFYSLIPASSSVSLTEPASWSVSATANLSVTATQVAFSVNANGGTLNVDNFILASDYASVVSAVPEVSTSALLAGFACFACGLARRRFRHRG